MENWDTILKEIDATDGKIRKQIKDLAPKLFDLLDKVFYYSNDIEIYLPKEGSNHKFLYTFSQSVNDKSICVYEIEEVKRKWWMPVEEVKYPVLRLVRNNDNAEVSATCPITLEDLLTLEMAISTATKFVSDKVCSQKKTSNDMLGIIERIEVTVLGEPDVNENL